MFSSLLDGRQSVKVMPLTKNQKIIRPTGFSGAFAESGNGKNVLIFTDGNPHITRYGEYVVVCDDMITYQATMMRPKHGKIANNGTFIFNDWMFDEKLQGTFYAFRPNGTQIVHHYVEAIPFSTGLSENGQFAVMQCSGNPTSTDGMQLFFYDLEKCELCWHRQPVSGRSMTYRFDLQAQQLILENRHQPDDIYSFSGEYLGVVAGD